MKKNYTNWHPIKKALNNSEEDRVFFHEREIWFCHLGENVGFEQDGRGDDFLRPIVIYRKFNNEIFWAIPLTKSSDKIKSGAEKYYYNFCFSPNIISVAILSQIRLIDAKRLVRQIGMITEDDFEKLNKKFKDLLP